MPSSTGIRIRFDVTGLQSNAIGESDFLRTQEFAVTIDGETHQVGGKPEALFACAPGPHRVEVVLHLRAPFGIGVLERFETAKARPSTGATCDVVVPADGVATLRYESAGLVAFSLTPE